MESPDRVAFLGLGIMGLPMAANLRAGGFDLAVWTRDADKAERFASEHGAVAAGSPAEAAEGAGAVITMVPDSPEVEAVLFGDGGAAAALERGALCLDMSTIAPTAARAIGERLGERQIDFVDAPVTGSRPRAEDGTLTIMAGGSETAFQRALPLLRAMGKLIVHVGPSGHGAMAKVIANTITSVNAAAIAEALTMVRRAGVNPDAFLEVARAGSSGSTMMELKAGPMLEHDFEPLFKLEHMLKDVRHCLAEARALGVELRLAELAERMYAAAAEAGHGDEDFAAVATVAEAAGGQDAARTD
ncbi:MAG TPA: NAD(P)-dependent oxidoreductase [Thermoleophilaceae bacterium]|jgi:3-hydroxyisobutyrate dehydrogenase-like beta-hydroxyacid dehydrogenase